MTSYLDREGKGEALIRMTTHNFQCEFLQKVVKHSLFHQHFRNNLKREVKGEPKYQILLIEIEGLCKRILTQLYLLSDNQHNTRKKHPQNPSDMEV
jgi:predicted SprT family Zn-dependent metalloprotease